MPTSILDLPTELILEIIHSDDSTDATIAYLGMTCRRLHDICQVLVMERQLPVLRALVSRHRLLTIHKNSGSIAMKDEELGDIKEIFQASFHKINYVAVTFTVEEIASVRRLIFHANAVGHIHIKLNPPSYRYSQIGRRKDWCKPLASLIRVSSEKDMESLTITGLPYEGLGYFTPRLRIPQTPSSPAKKHSSIFSSLKNLSFRHKARSGGICTQPSRQVGTPERERLLNTGVYFGTARGLKSVKIHSPLPFHEACFPQTLRVLNSGYLTKLSLSGTRLCMSDWSNIFPLLSMPLLSEFDVGDSVIAFRDLSPFLLRHPSITHLGLSFSGRRGPMMPPAGFLPRLKVISGNPDYLLELLSSRRHLSQNLCSVVLTQYPLQAFQQGALDNTLRNFSNRKIAVELSICIGLVGWFYKAKSKPCSLACVKTLGIIDLCISSWLCDSFISWISVFPYVQKLVLTQAVPPDPKMWTWRLDALWYSCPELQLIIVGVRTYQRPVKAVSRQMR